MKRLAKFIGSLSPILILLFIEIFLFSKNYVPNTWLIGWDSTMPELNQKLNFYRQVNAIWQEYRGLGILDGMAHAANLMHTFYIWLLSLVLPANLIRYVFTLLMHFLGGVGVYFLVSYLLNGENKYFKKISAFVASLFYLFNPATIQMFYTPFETFTIHFGFLPWLFWVLMNFLEKGTKKWALWLFAVNLLAVSQAHVPTVFIVYALGFLLICLWNLTSNIRNWKRIIVSLFILGAVNSFWLAPYVYSALNSASSISNSKVNRLSNEEIVLMNQNYGDLKSVVLLRGFSLDYGDWSQDLKNFDYQLGGWREHWFNDKSELAGYVLFGFALLGIAYSFWAGKSALPFFLIFIFSLFNLATDVPYFSSVKKFLDASVPFYKEVFRFTYTKFVLSYGLALSVFLGFGLLFFLKILRKYLGTIVLIAVIGLIIFLAKPAFEGGFFYQNLRLNIPEEYFEIIAYFNRQGRSSGRAMLLPQPSFWNWEYEKWGYRGSGFIWQGINSTLHRAFDPWDAENETYYWELNRIISRGDAEGFRNLLQKYAVTWIIFDRNIVQPGEWGENFFVNETVELLNQTGNLERVYDTENITLYRNNSDRYLNYLISSSFTRIDADLIYASDDFLYSPDTVYVQDREGITYPFANFDSRKQPEVRLIGEKIEFLSHPLEFQSTKHLVVDNEFFGKDSGKLPKVEVDQDKRARVIFSKPEFITTEYFFENGLEEAKNCNILEDGRVSKEFLGDEMVYQAEENGVSCDFIPYEDLEYGQGYLLRIKGVNSQGRSLKIYLQNWQTKRMDLEELLPPGNFDEVFFVSPSKLEGSGYSLNLETRSFGKLSSQNSIEKIEFYPIPVDWLRTIKLIPENSSLQEQDGVLKINKVKKYGTFSYVVDVDLPAQAEGEGLLVLGQGYDKGWLAFSFQPSAFSNQPPVNKLIHTRVNSWANGFLVETSQNQSKSVETNFNQFQPISTIYLVFWPQLLEFAGFGIMILTLVVIAVDKSNRKPLQ